MMISRRTFFAFGGYAMLCGCSGVSALDPNALVSSASTLGKAATLSDADVRTLSDQACAQHDRSSKIAPAGGKYQQRLARVMRPLDGQVNGQPVNARVYITNDVNAWAMANGQVRVYSGLMDIMTDDELRGVIGHETGHVALGHTKHA